MEELRETYWNVTLACKSTTNTYRGPHKSNFNTIQKRRGEEKRREEKICCLTREADEGHVVSLTTSGKEGDLLLGPPLHLHSGKHLFIMGYEDLFVDRWLGTHLWSRQEWTADKQFKWRGRDPLLTKGEEKVKKIGKLNFAEKTAQTKSWWYEKVSPSHFSKVC